LGIISLRRRVQKETPSHGFVTTYTMHPRRKTIKYPFQFNVRYIACYKIA
jgi:hypothetical protein